MSYSNNMSSMSVIKRNGVYQKVSFDKVITRIESLCWDLDMSIIDPIDIAKDTIKMIHNGITTEEIDHVSADVCAGKIIDHPDFNKLATRIVVSNLHKTVKEDFSEVIEKMHNNTKPDGSYSSLINKDIYDIVKNNKDIIQSQFDFSRDYFLTFFGIKTLQRAYLVRVSSNSNKCSNNNNNEKEKEIDNKYGKIIERPQHMWMRVALGIHGNDLNEVFETYNLLSKQYFTHASPTLYNACSIRPQLSSCFLLGMNDSIEGIFKTFSDCGRISKWAGGIGIHISSVRGYNEDINGTNGTSEGTIPMCRVLNSIARYVNQGGKRKGAIAVYFEPWHPDTLDLIDLRRGVGDEEKRARDLFLALWTPDLFMKRVQNDEMWSFISPFECPELKTTYGEEFEKIYTECEKKGKIRGQIKARKLFNKIQSAMIETGMPYMCFKDNVNKKSNQINVGVIQSSNLCSEIMEYSDENEQAVCNLASICLPAFIIKNNKNEINYDYNKLYEVTRVAVRNLNKIIDINFYPTKEAERSNMRHRPIGLGVQGIADLFNIMGFSFESNEANTLNKKIFETIYYAALTESNELAKIYGPYSTFKGSPFSKGLLQWNLWNLKKEDLLIKEYNWDELIESIKKHGTRNSLLTALMPTASTSQIMGNNECIEPYTSNMYVRNTIAGEYLVMNENLINDLIKLGLWNDDIRDEILYDNGSIQNIKEIPENIKEIYKTAFEISQKSLLKLEADRGPFIDQGSSHNNFMAQPDFKKLYKALMYAWKKGLKTGQYYLRSQTVVNAQKFGLDADTKRKIRQKRGLNVFDNKDIKEDKSKNRFRRPDNYEECDMCSG